MKNFYFLIIALTILSATFSSCTKDNDTKASSAIPAELVGKWHQVSEKQVHYEGGIQKSVYEQTDYPPTTFIQFNSDGSASFNENGSVQMTYKIAIKDGMIISTDNTGKRIDADSRFTVTATTLNLHQDVVIKQSNITGTIDYDFIKVN